MSSIIESIYNYFDNTYYQKKTIVIVSGFWDPICPNHTLLFEEAKKLGDYLIVGINSDVCGLMKKGQPVFMPFKDRKEICEKLQMVDGVVGFEDSDGTACQLIQDIYNKYKEEIDSGLYELIFANGDDRTPDQDACPEQKYVDEHLPKKVKMVYGVGGFHKRASSSEYLKNWVNNTMIRYKNDFRLQKKY